MEGTQDQGHCILLAPFLGVDQDQDPGPDEEDPYLDALGVPEEAFLDMTDQSVEARS